MIFIFKSWQLSMTLKISTEIAVDVSVREMKFILNWRFKSEAAIAGLWQIDPASDPVDEIF